MTWPMTRTKVVGALALACAASACGSRPSYWDLPVSTVSSYGLANGVALVDDSDHRVVMLTAGADQQLDTRSLSIGHNVATGGISASADGTHLFVLTAGDWPRKTASDQYPSLSVIDDSNFAPTVSQYTMTVPMPNLAIDPLGSWAVAYTGPSAPSTFVQNANELVIFDLTKPGSMAQPRTIRSLGGTPQRLTFSPLLNLPKGPGRLLIIETDIDVTLLELGNTVPDSEVTVPLTSGTTAQQVQPAGVVVDGFLDPTTMAAEPRIALRAANDRNVFTLTLGPSDTHDFTPIINEVDVGGVPTDIAFVRADMGVLRVAALVPNTSSAMLVEPDTGITTQVMLPAAYSRLSLVTDVVPGATAGTDVAMLWDASNGGTSGVAYWLLGNTVGQPYFSVEPIAISRAVREVDDVSINDHLKVLETGNAGNTTETDGFFVLDLVLRTASPLVTQGAATISIAPDRLKPDGSGGPPDGGRLWAFVRNGTDLAKVDFTTLNPVNLFTDLPIDAVYDVARPAGGRSLIAIHRQATIGATVFDAFNPDNVTAHRIPSLLLEGP